ncbi:MAG TPA: MG2 domain-containing protein [Pyrinomonadaceae bacterium]|nr:MG2 domain-containing protein [Pyrinomonadaceae bacterium]
MNRKLIFTVFFSLLASLTATAQVFLKVNESETKANFENGQLQTNLVVENSAAAVNARVKLEVLDAQDNVLASSETLQNLRRGKQNFLIPVTFSAVADTGELLWKRLRYTILPENSAVSISNIVSLSEIMPEVFELQISAPERIFAGMNLRAHILALHPFTKRPVKNVEISGDLELKLATESDETELVVKAKGKTNDEGFTSLDFKIPASAKLDDGEIKIKGVKNGIVREADESLETSVEAFVYLNTDKPIYQPNQKLFVRGLYLDPLKRPLADKELNFEISDEEGETVYEGTAKTSRFGVMNIEWQIPESFKLGTYKIEIENDGEGVIGLAQFKVSRYDLPNFTVTAKSSKPFYLTTEKSALITVNANYLFGKPVTGGKVRVVQEKSRRWNYEKQEYETEEGAPLEGETDAEGKFTRQIDLTEAQENLARDNWKRFADVKFAAYFTDLTTNRTEQRRFDIRISKGPIHVYFIRQSADPNPKVPYLFYVSTFYADGTPVKCDLKIEGNYAGTTLQTKLAEDKTNSYGASKFEVRFPDKPFPEAKNEFNFRIIADDKKGNRGLLEDNLSIDDDEKQVRVRTDKTIYLPNEPVDLKIFSSENEQTVFVDVLKNSSVIYSKRVRIEDNRANLLIPFRPDFKGEITIAAYFKNSERYSENAVGSKTILYPGAANLNLNLKSLKTAYRPNEDARLTFSVQNNEKKPQTAALGVLILDKAIEERARTEQLPDNFASIRRLLGTADTFGNLTRRDLDNLDLTQPIDNDLQLAAEFLLVNKTFEPNFFESDSFQYDFSRIYQDYFNKKLESFEKIIKENYEKTGDFPKDENALRQILSANGVNFDELHDAWEMPFQAKFSADRADTILTLKTAGADKKTGSDDDFTVKEIRFEWFRKTQNELSAALNNYREKTEKSPNTAEELKAIWKESGINFDSLRDGWNRPLYLEKIRYDREIQKVTPETVGNLDGERQQVMRSKLVAQKVILFRIRSAGADGIQGVFDDFNLAAFTVVLEEKDLSNDQPKTEIFKTRISGAKGAVGGTITDQMGAVVPGANVSAANMSSGEIFSVRSDENGEFLLANLPSGKYKITAESPGFQQYVIENVVVSSMNLVSIKIILEVGGVTSTVDVTADVSMTVNSSSSSIRTVTRSEAGSIAGIFENNKDAPSFTPRVREYFPETLLWQPELLTDKYGKAELKFKLGDNLTTWKLYAFGSTETGEIGLVEQEFQTFQPFFAELDPPRILTEGDEIALPVPVRNYTDKRQKVTVSMTANDWSRNLSGAAQNIEVPASASANAVFNFQAVAPVTDGKQKVTALAKGEGDAIEKTVTVRPNGKEIIETQSNIFNKSASFDVNFPTAAFPNNRRAEIKIYPNMLAHVAESVEGLLKRPYGCGEQTTSSTYPNLMILKIDKELKKDVDPRIKAQAKIYLEEGYKRLLNYQTGSGGFSYWGKTDTPNAALTAYVLRFLHDAGDFTQIDETVVERAENWLLREQKVNGSWESSQGNTDVSTAYILRSLSLTAGGDAQKRKALQTAVGFLGKRFENINDAFVLANLALALQETGETETAQKAIEKLQKLAQTKSFSQFWTTPNTPFNGWGTTAQIETTALVVQALLQFQPPQRDLAIQSQIFYGLSFLLKNKDRYGVWHSTQTTVNVLDALILFQKTRLSSEKNGDEKAEIYINGKKAQEFPVSDKGLNSPVIFDASAFLTADNNRIEIRTSEDLSLTMAQIVSKHYIDWSDAREVSPYFDLKVDFDKLQAKIGEEIICKVLLQRKEGRYGMVLAEIGLPPGADVDRASLEKAKAEGRFSRYDVLPDRVIVYLWSSSGAAEFNFKFKPRFGLSAQTAPSLVYDYYNEEAKATLAPQRFEVK